MSNLCLNSWEKLKTSKQFSGITSNGTKCFGKCFLLIHFPNELGHARLGITVSKKTSKKATVRNRIKRIVRESFRLNKQYLPGLDIVIISRKRARHAPAEELRQDLAKLWQQLIV